MDRQETGASAAPVLFSIIIVTYNSSGTIVPCLESAILCAASETEIIVVDNCSRDDTVSKIRAVQKSYRNFPLELITNNQNQGFTAASNQGIRAGSGAYVVLLNPDTVVTSSWLHRLMRAFADPAVAAAGPVSNFAAGRQSVAYHWQGTLPDSTTPEKAARFLAAVNSGKTEETKLLIGFAVMIRRDLLERYGGLDERLFLGADDLELSWRLRAHGYRLLIATDCFVYHEGQHSFKSDPETTTGALVQKSNDALYDILEECYGTGRIPSPDELWGIDWFTPFRASFNNSAGLRQLLCFPAATRLQRPLFSIIILAWNQLGYTQECIDSIRKHTSAEYEIIIVDNGSTDGTVAWLEELAAEDKRCRIILNNRNLGFAAGCNQGLSKAKGDWLVLLNNDVVVTPRWLEGLEECHRNTPCAGIVGPVTNNASGIQGTGVTPYSNTEELEQYACKFRRLYRHRRIFSRRLVGFCMMFPAEIYRQIGGLDERFGTGNYEDDDFCLRVSIAGYRNLIAADTYIHHYGSVSFSGGGIDYRSSISGNWRLFREKWSRPVDDPFYAGKIAACRIREDAEKLLSAQSYDAALQLLEQVCQNFAGDRLLPELYARALYLAGKYPESARAGNTVAKAHCLLASGSADEAEQLLYRIAAEEPGAGEGLPELSVLMRRRGEREYADALLVRAFVLNPVTTAGFLLEPGLGQYSIIRYLPVSEAARLHPESRAVARLAVFAASDEAELVRAAESYLLHFGVDMEILEKGVAARGITGLHSRAAFEIPAVSLCMIVRNEASHLAACLASCRPLVSQMIVVDTGSDDESALIAGLFGAEVIKYQWQSDFSSARNAGLAAATGKWILVMDADERLSVRDYHQFCQLFETAGNAAFSMVTRNYCNSSGLDGFVALDSTYPEDEAGTGWTPSEKIRLFSNHYNIRFEGFVHELVEPSVIQAGLPVTRHPVPVHHYGNLEAERLKRKQQVYYRLGIRKLAACCGNPDIKALYELAVQAGELGLYADAISLWKEFITYERSVAVAWFNLGYACLKSGLVDEAVSATEQALLLEPGHVAAKINMAICRFVTEPAGRYMLTDYINPSVSEDPAIRILMLLEKCLCGDPVAAVSGLKMLDQQGANPVPFINELESLLRMTGRPEEAGILSAVVSVIDSRMHHG